MSAVKQSVLVLCMVSVTIAGRAQYAAPYEADAYTLHLWHFDIAANAVVPDLATADPIDLPLVNQAALAISTAGFGNALNTYDGIAGVGPYAGDAVNPVAISRFTGSDGAFTFEAIVRPDMTPGAELSHMEMICGESDGTNDARGFQFRIQDGGTTLRFQSLAGAPIAAFDAPITYTAGTWYHAAVTYNGNANTAGNLKLYWTELGTAAAAQQVGVNTFNLTVDLTGTVMTKFAVGNELRASGGIGTENFEGLIDEVRISGVARAADEMLFVSSDILRPVILIHPWDVTVSEPHTAVFQTVFESPSTPIVQWFKVDSAGDSELTSDDPDIDIQTACDSDTQRYTTTLSMSNTSLAADTGGYYCRVNNDSNLPRNSTTAFLTVVGLVAHWTLDQSDFVSGFYIDRIAGYPAAAAGTPVFVAGANGPIDKAVHISPAGGWAALEGFAPSSTGVLTVSLWVNWQEPIGTTGDLAITGNFVSENTVAQPNGLKADGQWQHIGMVFDGATCTLYIDGLRRAEGPFALPTDMTSLLEIGSTDSGSESFNGDIDDLRIYNYAMNDTEVAELRYAFAGLQSCIFAYGDSCDWTGPEGVPDCRVDVYDVVDFAFHHLGSEGNYDLSGPLALPDGIVNLYDFSEMASVWMDCGLYPNCP